MITANDLRKATFITCITICGFLVPSLLGIQGLFSLPSLRIITFIFLLCHSIFTFYTMEYPTKATVAEVITLPLRTIAVLLVIVMASWVGLHVLGLNRIGARIFIVVGLSLIEFVFIYHSALYVGVLINYVLKRR